MMPCEKKIWFFLISLVLFVCIFNLFRVYPLRLLYFSSNARVQLFTALSNLRDSQGFYGTDLKLREVSSASSGFEFTFDYHYRHPVLDKKQEKIKLYVVGDKVTYLSL